MLLTGNSHKSSIHNSLKLTALQVVYTPLRSYAGPWLRHSSSSEHPLQLVGNDNRYRNPLCLGSVYRNHLRNDKYPDWFECYY